ncbi:MAG: thioredoxin fold domain-containing protein [Planctomycetota bacterium]
MSRVFLAAGIALALCRAASAGGIEWIDNDYDKAVAKAKEAGKLVLVHWRKDGCHWCTDLQEKTLATDDVAKFLGETCVSVRMDRAKYGQLAEKFHVDATPDTQFHSSDGRVVKRIVGFLPAEQFLAEAQSAPEAWKRIQELEAAIAKDDKDAASKLDLGRLLAAAGDLDAADRHLRAAAGLDTDNAKGLALEAWWTMADSRMREPRPDVGLAKEALAKVQELDPKNEKGRMDNAAVQLARIELNAAPKLAKASLEKIMADYPGTDGAAEAMFVLAADVLVDIDRNFDAGEAMLKKLAAEMPEDPWAKRVPAALEQLAVIRKESTKDIKKEGEEK